MGGGGVRWRNKKFVHCPAKFEKPVRRPSRDVKLSVE